MFIKALIAFLALPGIVAFIIPISVAYFSNTQGVLWAGIPVMLIGLLVLLSCVKIFYIAGKGTLAPWSPPQKLVVIGLYKFSRNPMYLGVLILVAGWAILLKSIFLSTYTVVLCLAFHIRIIYNEEPWLKNTFGSEWQVYKQKVPRWFSLTKKAASDT